MTTSDRYTDGYQTALADMVIRMSEESTAINALGGALGWILHNGDEETRQAAVMLVQRFLTESGDTPRADDAP